MASGVIDTTHVESADGTPIAISRLGVGPGLVVLHGTLRAAKHYAGLAAALAGTVTVYVVDRRGRGASGPQGDHYGIDAECADLAAVLAHTGARTVFGHSFGGLVGLEGALRGLPIDRLAVYEPAVSIDGGITDDWIPELEHATADGRVAEAVSALLTGLDLAGPLTQAPPRLRTVLARAGLRGELLADATALLATVAAEVRVAAALDSSGARYAGVRADTLLMSGERGPAYLREARDVLHAAIPASQVVTVPKAGHGAPDLESPSAVAAALLPWLSR
jgi:pimeloyl-ACP methyl ester carboxylesterase